MNNLNGKKIIYAGDSIMAQDGKIYEYPSAKYNIDCLGKVCRGYPTILEETLKVVNLANVSVGGHGIRQQREIILNTDFTEAEIVVITIGCNDFSGSVPIGELPDAHTSEYDDTFMGNYCTVMDYIYSQNPTVKCVLMTPLHRDTHGRVNPGPVNDISTVNQSGHKLSDYADAVKSIGAFYSATVADMYAQSGINRFNMPQFTFDGVHPNDDGYRHISPVLIDALKKLF